MHAPQEKKESLRGGHRRRGLDPHFYCKNGLSSAFTSASLSLSNLLFLSSRRCCQVGNLPWDMTASGLRTVFSEFSPYDVHIKTNMSGRSRGFGLLRFRSSEEAQSAIEQMHGITVQERKILVRLDRAHLEMMGHSPATMEASDTVTCGNIPWHTGDEVLACHMAQAGRVVSCQIQRHADTLRSKGWA